MLCTRVEPVGQEAKGAVNYPHRVQFQQKFYYKLFTKAYNIEQNVVRDHLPELSTVRIRLTFQMAG